MYIPIRHKPSAAGLAKGDPANTNMAYVQSGNNTTVPGPEGLPIFKPPYAKWSRVDMNRGEQLWRVPSAGPRRASRNNPALKGLNLDFDSMGEFDIRPGPLLTKEPAVHRRVRQPSQPAAAASSFRAYDKRTARWSGRCDMPTLVDRRAHDLHGTTAGNISSSPSPPAASRPRSSP